MKIYSEEDKTRITYFFQRYGFKNELELYNYVTLMFKKVPNVVVCEGHCSPFSFISDQFFEKVRNIVGFANRLGGKTENMAIINCLDMIFKPECEVAHLGAIKSQALKCLKYMRQYMVNSKKNIVFSDLVTDFLTQKAILSNGSLCEILTATNCGVNSPHPQKARIDEVELMDGDVLDESMSMTVSKPGMQAIDCYCSTRKFAYGVFQELLERAYREDNFIVKQWCVFEVLQRCKDRVCSRCRLNTICQGKAKRSDGFIAIDDFIDKYRKMSKEKLEAQWLNLRPEKKGLVYPEFDCTKHVAEEIFSFRDDLPIIRSIDFGYKHPFVCLYIQYDVDADRFYIVKEYYARGKTVNEHAKALVEYEMEMGIYHIIKYSFADGASADGIATLAEHGIDCDLASKAILDGIDAVHTYLKLNEDGKPGLIFSKDCKNCIEEMGKKYCYSEEKKGKQDQKPIKAFDDCMDALRYAVFSFFQSDEGLIFIDERELRADAFDM